MKDRIATSVFWIFWSRGGLQAASFLNAIFVARLLRPEDYGVMALVGIFTGVITTISQMGLGAAVVQFQDMDDHELNNCFWLSLGVTFLCYAGLFAAAPGIAAWFQAPILSDVLRVAGLSLPLTAAGLVPDALLRRQLSFDKTAVSEILAGAATIPCTLTLAWLGAGVWALVSATLLSPLVHNVVVFRFVRWSPGLPSFQGRIKEILRYSLATLGARVGWDVYSQTDVFILGKISGEQALGFYSMAMQFAMLPVTKISVPVNGLAFPVMSGLQGNLPAMRASFLRGLRMVACVTMPICAGMLLAADDVIAVVLTAKWASTVPLLQVLVLCALVRSLLALFPPVLFARYRAAFLCSWIGLVAVVMAGAFWAGASALGPFGVALAWVLVYPWLAAWMAQQTMREIGVEWRTIWAQLSPLVLPVAAMVGSIAIVHTVILGTELYDRLVRLIVSVGAGAAVYSGMLYWRGGRLFPEIIEVLGWLLRPRRELSAQK